MRKPKPMSLFIALPPVFRPFTLDMESTALSAEVIASGGDGTAVRALLDRLEEIGHCPEAARWIALHHRRHVKRCRRVAQALVTCCGDSDVAKAARAAILQASLAWVPWPSVFIEWGYRTPEIIGEEMGAALGIAPGSVLAGCEWVHQWLEMWVQVNGPVTS